MVRTPSGIEPRGTEDSTVGALRNRPSPFWRDVPIFDAPIPDEIAAPRERQGSARSGLTQRSKFRPSFWCTSPTSWIVKGRSSRFMKAAHPLEVFGMRLVAIGFRL